MANSIPENVERLGINFWIDTKYVKPFLCNLSNLSNLREMILFRNIMITDEILIEIKDFIKEQKEDGKLLNLTSLYYLPEKWIRFSQKFIGFSQSEIEKAKEFIPIIKKYDRLNNIIFF